MKVAAVQSVSRERYCMRENSVFTDKRGPLYDVDVGLFLCHVLPPNMGLTRWASQTQTRVQNTDMQASAAPFKVPSERQKENKPPAAANMNQEDHLCRELT